MDQFYSTTPAPCPYLAGRMERRLVTYLSPPDAGSRHDLLTLAGFRRSQTIAYRTACEGCRACVPVRVRIADFVPGRSFRRILKRSADLTFAERPARATEEQYALFHRYLTSRHQGGGMAMMSWNDYRAMVEDSPVDTRLVEFRDGDGLLMAASLTDVVAGGLSGVYKFFDPDQARRSLGSYIILWHIRRARELGLSFVYLGFWIAGNRKMAYKARFGPLEQLTRNGWDDLDVDKTVQSPDHSVTTEQQSAQLELAVD